MKRLLLALVFVIACCPSKPAVKKPEPKTLTVEIVSTASKQLDLIEKVRLDYPKVTAKVEWIECKQRNSYYWPLSFKKFILTPNNTIQLCTEMADMPNVALFYAAHEMGHAVSDAYTSTWSEIDADELAVLFLVKLGMGKAVHETASWWSLIKNQDWTEGDEHPGFRFRVWYMECLEWGSHASGSEKCRGLYEATKWKWTTRL